MTAVVHLFLTEVRYRCFFHSADYIHPCPPLIGNRLTDGLVKGNQLSEQWQFYLEQPGIGFKIVPAHGNFQVLELVLILAISLWIDCSHVGIIILLIGK